MCLILFAHQVAPAHRLVLAANRDEFLSRDSLPMHWWEGEVSLCAGKDLEAGGTWFGINRMGCWAAVTNYRGEQENPESARSRGEIVVDFLSSQQPAVKFLDSIQMRSHEYRGFNLLLADQHDLFYFSNREHRRDFRQPLQPGIYGLCNHLLDTAWPKVQLGKSKLRTAMQTGLDITHEGLFHLLADRTRPATTELPDTGIGLEKEELLSSMFISSPAYGTRCSTSLLIGHDGSVALAEKTYPVGSEPSFEFTCQPNFQDR